MPRNGSPSDMRPDLALDIRGLHEVYAGGLDPVHVVDRVFEAIEKAADPGIFISLADRKAEITSTRSVRPSSTS